MLTNLKWTFAFLLFSFSFSRKPSLSCLYFLRTLYSNIMGKRKAISWNASSPIIYHVDLPTSVPVLFLFLLTPKYPFFCVLEPILCHFLRTPTHNNLFLLHRGFTVHSAALTFRLVPAATEVYDACLKLIVWCISFILSTLIEYKPIYHI